jgi:hypothetical protein
MTENRITIRIWVIGNTHQKIMPKTDTARSSHVNMFFVGTGSPYAAWNGFELSFLLLPPP